MFWSFPMRYLPTDRPDRRHVGEKWSRYQLRSMQIILQATHGVVSGAPDFFKRAFGDTFEDYERILLLPHDFIFNREWFERFDAEERLEAYRAEFAGLADHERTELIELLSSCDPREFAGLASRARRPLRLSRFSGSTYRCRRMNSLRSGQSKRN